MKKLVYGLGFALALGLASCGGADGKIDDLKEVNSEISKVNGDTSMDKKEKNAKLYELKAKRAKIEADLASKDLTKKQEEAKSEAYNVK